MLKHLKAASDKSRGTEWSRYRQQKGIEFRSSGFPGPGSYGKIDDSYNPQEEKSYYGGMDETETRSWQFKSTTKRNPFLQKQNPRYSIGLRESASKMTTSL